MVPSEKRTIAQLLERANELTVPELAELVLAPAVSALAEKLGVERARDLVSAGLAQMVIAERKRKIGTD